MQDNCLSTLTVFIKMIKLLAAIIYIAKLACLNVEDHEEVFVNVFWVVYIA
jgi:hypothetical protein